MEKIPVLILFIITLAANLTGGLVRAYYSKNISSSVAGYHIFNAASSLACSITLLILSGGNFSLSPYTFVMAVIFGIITALQQVTNSAALSIGPFSYTSVIISMSTVITALSGMMFFNEKIRTTQIFGIILMALCLILSVKKEEDEQKQKSVRWFIFSIISCICCGGVGIMQKVHQSSDYKNELTMFLIIAFICSFLFSSVNIFTEKKEKIFNKKKSVPLLCIIFFAGGIGIALNNMINLYLSGVVESAIFFPIVNGGGLILVTVSSLVFFKEKLTSKQWIGLAFGIVATLLLCI